MAKSTSDNRIVVYVDGAEAGAAARASILRSDGKDKGIFLNAEIELTDLTLDLETKLQHEAFKGVNRFTLVLEHPDGRKLIGNEVFVKALSTSRTTLLASRLGWAP